MSNPNPKRSPATEFKPGNKLGGRPKGSRDKLSGDFIRRLGEDFERFGIYAIARVRHDDPAAYLRLVAGLVPKELKLMEKNTARELSDDELLEIIRSGTSGADGDEGEVDKGEKPARIH